MKNAKKTTMKKIHTSVAIFFFFITFAIVLSQISAQTDVSRLQSELSEQQDIYNRYAPIAQQGEIAKRHLALANQKANAIREELAILGFKEGM